MVEIHTYFQGSLYNVMRFAPFHVDDQADAAVFVFVLRIVETLRLWLSVGVFHICLKLFKVGAVANCEPVASVY